LLKDEQRVSLGNFVGSSYRQNPTPNYDPKRRKLHVLHTYTFTIDIVPLVMEVHYIAGVILEYKEIIVKYTIKQSAKQGNEKKVHPHIKSGPSTNVAWTQALPGAHLRKAVARQASRGAAAMPPSQLGLSLLWRLHGGMQRRCRLVSYFSNAKPTMLRL